jgi:uncharacterized protein
MPNIEQWVPQAQAAFVAAMQRPEAYPAHPTQTPIHCVETHISWVFLTGPYAYKVKKPLRLSFLDYSTPSRRLALCREELRLNRRHAPDLYLDVVPISGTPERPRVGDASAAPFEHALRMVQFDPACELSRLLAAGTVQAAEIARLGVDLARAHDAAEVAGLESHYGVPERIHQVTLDNFTEIAQHAQDGTVITLLAALHDHVEQTFAASRQRMAARKGLGRIRECHGDLHSGNVVRWGDRLVAFDGLEFDPALRFIDVASDVAFLAMDLGARGRPDLRRLLLNAWTETSGDFDAAALLPYYETYRALVRAKVSALRHGDDAREAATAQAETTRYLEWARRHAAQADSAVILMVGLSGSGKTWLARQLAPALDAFHLRSDIERKRLAGLGPLEPSSSPPDAGIYSREFTERTYQRLLDCAANCLAGHANVIVDAASLRRDERKRFAALARDMGARFALVHCTAPVAVLKQRVASRLRSGTDASEATSDLLDRQPSYWERFDPSELRCTVTVRSDEPDAVDRALAAVRHRLAPDVDPPAADPTRGL